MKNKPTALLLTLLVVGSNLTYSQDVPQRDLTVESVVALALQNNRQLVNSRLQRSVDRYALKIAESEFWPRVLTQAYTDRDQITDLEATAVENSIRLKVQTGGELSLGSRFTQNTDLTQDSPSNTGVMNLTFTQPLLRGGGLRVGRSNLQRAQISEEISVLALKSAVINLITNVIRTYRSHVQARQQTAIASRSLERANELLEVNRLLVETGRMAEQDVVQAQADIARRELNLVASQSNLDSTRLALIDILDLDTDTQFGVLDTLDPTHVSQPNLDSAANLEVALQNRPDVLSAVLGTRDAEIRSHLAKNGRLWDISLNMGWTFRGEEDDFSLIWDEFGKAGQRVSLNLEIPIGRSAVGQAELAHRQAEANLKIAKNTLADLRQRIIIDVENAVRDTEIAARRVDLAKRARQLAEQKADIEREKLSLGVTTNFQLVSFENDLVIAETDELNATVDYLNAVSNLDRAMGTTLEKWQVDIELLNAPYDESSVNSLQSQDQ